MGRTLRQEEEKEASYPSYREAGGAVIDNAQMMPTFSQNSPILFFNRPAYPAQLQNDSPGLVTTQISEEEKKTDLAKKLAELLGSLENVSNMDRVLIRSQPKVTNRLRTNSSRRSQYIGVFKNGPKWQALISIDGKKRYISTYTTEMEAAKAYDMVSIMLKSYIATTNFDYSKRSILELIDENSIIINKFTS